MSSRETVILVSALAAVAALFPAYLSFTGKEGHGTGPIVQAATASTESNRNALRAIAPYLLAVPRALIAIPSKPLSVLVSSLGLAAAPLPFVHSTRSMCFVALQSLRASSLAV
ncbi:hypothetical protein OPQ81_007659 [Rhizoctonia solani]|nr:hypothetical protein OPQ81_007659 [Rhizoctonia solani]